MSRHLNRRYSTCCCLVENGCILVISVSVFPFPPEPSLSYIHMVVIPVSCLCSCVGSSNVLMPVRDIPVSQWSIHFICCLLLIVSCNGCFVFPLIIGRVCLYLALLCVPRVTSEVRVSSSWDLCLVVLPE